MVFDKGKQGNNWTTVAINLYKHKFESNLNPTPSGRCSSGASIPQAQMIWSPEAQGLLDSNPGCFTDISPQFQTGWLLPGSSQPKTSMWWAVIMVAFGRNPVIKQVSSVSNLEKIYYVKLNLCFLQKKLQIMLNSTEKNFTVIWEG